MTVRESALDWIDVLAAGDHPQALAGGRVPVDLGARPVWQSCHHHGVSTPETALVQALEDVRLKSRGFWKSAVQDVQETVLVGLKAVMMESLRTAGHGGNAVDDMMRALNGLEQSWEAYEREVEDQLWTGASAPPQVTPPSLQAEPLDPFSAP